MCGIAGYISRENKNNFKKKLTKMVHAVSHRGPDGKGFFYSNKFGFGHRRLSIIDLSENGIQPMHYHDSNLVIIHNGEIYNYIEIKKTLKNEGYIFKNNTDTEVILAAYHFWGFDCVNHFNGMWSFALYDKKKEIIFCSRDRFGIKPFYYTFNEKKFIFGSEIRQILPNLKNIKANKY